MTDHTVTAEEAKDIRPCSWLSLARPDGGGIHLRVTRANDGRWVIRDIYVHGGQLSMTDLQSIPLTQIDLAMNLNGDLASFALIPSDEVQNEPTLAELRNFALSAPANLPAARQAARPRLSRPDGTDPDGFAARVAAAYREYVTKTRAPAVEIAKEAGVPVGTVRGWIREARRRGKLPQGHRGKVG